MSKNVEFELNLPGLNELMKSGEMETCLRTAGQAVAHSAGSGFNCRVWQHPFVAICNVYPDTREAAIKNAKENALVKALGSAGLGM